MSTPTRMFRGLFSRGRPRAEMMIMIFYLYLEMIDGNDDMNEKHFINDRFL